MGAAASLPYKINENFVYVLYQKIHDAIDKNGNEVSVFVYTFDDNILNLERKIVAKNCINSIKTLRHPNISKYIESDIDNQQNTNSLCYVTERVTPLSEIFRKGVKMSLDEILLGLYQIASALKFLHECGKSHTNVCSDTIFVTNSGDQKLGGFDLLYNFEPNLFLPEKIRQNIDLIPSVYLPEELTKKNWDLVSKSPIYSIDSQCFACLVYECFNGIVENRLDITSNTKSIPKLIIDDYLKMLNKSPFSRCSITKFLKNIFFAKNNFVKSIDFLENLALKSEDLKHRFFKNLPDDIEKQPKPSVCFKILPILTHELQHGSELDKYILISILKIGYILDDRSKQQKMILPSIIYMFYSKSRKARSIILENLPLFISLIDSDSTINELFIQFLTGLTDTLPLLREQSVRSVHFFTPRIRSDLIIFKLIPILIKLQNDSEPSIRTDVVITFSKISSHIAQDKVQNTLFKVYVRGLKDSFIQTRIATFQALSNTLNFFSVETLAEKILPNISIFSVDSVKNIRLNCLQCIELILKKLQENSKFMDKKDLEVLKLNEQNSKTFDENNLENSKFNSFTKTAIVNSVPVKKLGNMIGNFIFSSKLNNKDAKKSNLKKIDEQNKIEINNTSKKIEMNNFKKQSCKLENCFSFSEDEFSKPYIDTEINKASDLDLKENFDFDLKEKIHNEKSFHENDKFENCTYSDRKISDDINNDEWDFDEF